MTEKEIKKAIIFDSGALISLSIAGLFPELEKLKQSFDGYFFITGKVREELVDKPLKIKRFELEALRIKSLLSKKILDFPQVIGIEKKVVDEKADEIMNIANTSFESPREDVKIIHFGEASCLALSKILTEKGIKNIIAIDERTTRMLSEKPENLKDLLQKKLHTKITTKRTNFDYFKDFKIIRSTELIYVAYKKGFVELKDGETILDALLYALKFNGCSISSDEIEEIKRMK